MVFDRTQDYSGLQSGIASRSWQSTVFRCAQAGFAVLATSLGITTFAHAQAPVERIISFGQSYLDFGTARCVGQSPTLPARCKYPLNAPAPNVPYITYPYYLQLAYDLEEAASLNYAVGSATTTTAPAGLSMPVQIRTFLSSGGTFAPTDLIIYQAFGNDQIQGFIASAFQGRLTAEGGEARALAEATRSIADIQTMVGAGARTISIMNSGNLGYTPTFLPFTQPGSGGAAYMEAYDTAGMAALQAGLLPLAEAGTRMYLFDTSIFIKRLHDNPQMYGFSDTASAYSAPNDLHFTSAGHTIIADYVKNQLDGPTTVGPQGGIAMSLASGFAASTFSRLDAWRSFAPAEQGSAMDETSRWSVIGELNHWGSDRDRQFYAAEASASATGGNLGVDYRVSDEWRAGLVFSGAQQEASLGVQDAEIDTNAVQISAYGSYTGNNLFFDSLLAYGHQNHDMIRDGVIDTLSGSTEANLYTAAARTGYLFELGTWQTGPIGSLNYTTASIDGYTEQGDVLIAQTVSGQRLESLIGSLGVHLKAPMPFGGRAINAFANLTAEHEFLDQDRILTTSLVSAPLLPILTPVNDRLARTYGRFESGISGPISDNVIVSINGYSTFARDGGNDYGLSGRIKFAF